MIAKPDLKPSQSNWDRHKDYTHTSTDNLPDSGFIAFTACAFPLNTEVLSSVGVEEPHPQDLCWRWGPAS